MSVLEVLLYNTILVYCINCEAAIHASLLASSIKHQVEVKPLSNEQGPAPITFLQQGAAPACANQYTEQEENTLLFYSSFTKNAPTDNFHHLPGCRGG